MIHNYMDTLLDEKKLKVWGSFCVQASAGGCILLLSVGFPINYSALVESRKELDD